MNQEVVGALPELPTIETPMTAVQARVKTDRPMLFTLSKWGAVAHISGQVVAIEGAYPDPWTIFPARVMKQVDYGIALGLECRVVEYHSVNGVALGTVLYLTSGRMDIGCYAMKYGADGRGSKASGVVQ